VSSFFSVEVVVNDWGLLSALHEVGYPIRLTVGRLLNKMLRDPRVAPLLVPSCIPSVNVDVFREGSFSSKYISSLLRSFDVRSVEFDCIIQGLSPSYMEDVRSMGFACHLYIPHIFVTRGYSCPIAAIRTPYKNKYVESNFQFCGCECERVLMKGIFAGGNGIRGGTYYYIGNEILYKVPFNEIRTRLKESICFVDRLVYIYLN